MCLITDTQISTLIMAYFYEIILRFRLFQYMFELYVKVI